ncbi:hypothetical protein SprV_0301326200 [Sparganum proliferum]
MSTPPLSFASVYDGVTQLLEEFSLTSHSKVPKPSSSSLDQHESHRAPPYSAATLVAATSPTNPFVDPPLPNPPTAALPTDRVYTSGPSPLLAPDVYEPGHNIRDWLCDLDLFLTDVPPHQHTCFLLRFLSSSARRRAFDAGLTPTTPFSIARHCVLQLFETPDTPGIAAERFATLRQAPRQSVDDFATELTRLASAAFPNLPHHDRNDLILHRFISGLSDRTITDSFLLHPPCTLNDALRQCRLYLTYHRAHQPPPRPPQPPARTEPQAPERRNALPVRFPDHNPGCQYCAAFGPRARHCGHNPPCKSTPIDAVYFLDLSSIPAFTVPVLVDSHPTRALVDTGANVSLVTIHKLPNHLLRHVDPLPAPRSLRAANGTPIPVSATVSLQLMIENTHISHRFLVTPDGPWPLVLGLDFLEAHDCVVHVRDRQLTLGRTTTASAPPAAIDDFDLMYNSVLSAVALDPIPLDTVLPAPSVIGPVAHDQLKTLLNSFPDLFAWSTDTIGRTHLIQHTIDTGDAKPVWQPPRRIPVRYREEVNKLLDELLQAKIIQPSSSPWASPIALVPKKDGSVRLCVDYRRLNAVTVRDSFPLPRLDDTLDALGNAAWFSTLDLKSGYWQVEIHPDDRHKTAFTVPQGLYEFQTLPFGLCNAAATFQRLMYRVLQPLIPDKCLVYLDDIIVFGRSVDEHNHNLRAVLEALRSAGLTLNPTKCLFLRREVNFLGHLISPGRISPLPDRIQCIRTWPTPTTQTELRSFLGLASYYRRFIRDFAHIASPLHKLTEKGRPFVWSDDCVRAFTDLRAALCSAPLLALPNVDKDAPPFILDTDASGYAIGAVLSQADANGVEHPICFASNTLTKPQRNYCTFRRELLAIVVFLRQFKHLLIGRRFILRTDHRALQWLRSFKDPMDQLARWQEFLQDFDFECQYRPGPKHGNADALSRLPPIPDTDPDVQTAAVNAIVMSEPTRHEWTTAPATDPDTATIYRHLTLGLPKPTEQEMRGASQNARLLLNQWPYLTVENDILFLRDPTSNRLCPVVPGCLIESVLTDLHTQLGHSGQRRTELAARSRFWWPQLRSAVQHFCQSCVTCATFKPPSPSPRAPLQPMTTDFPGERVGLDILGPLPISVRGFEYVLVMVDYFTKWVEAVPLLRQDAASVANAISRTWISRWGAPLSFHSDCGANFQSQLLQEVCEILEIRKTRTTPYHPEGNGLVERTNRTLHDLLLAFSRDGHEQDWDAQLPLCLLAYRGAVHSSTGFTPHYLWTGRDLRLPADLRYPLPTPDPSTLHEYATHLRGVIRSAHNAARVALGAATQHQKEQFDRHTAGTPHQVGDLVMHYNPVPPRGTSAKLHHPWQGPFTILDVLAPPRSCYAMPSTLIPPRLRHTFPNSNLTEDAYPFAPPTPYPSSL